MLWQWIVPICYFISSVFYCSFLWTKNQKAYVWGSHAIRLGVIFQSITLVRILYDRQPIAGGLDSSLELFSWFIALVYVVLQTKFKTEVIGAFVAPLALVMSLPSVIVPKGIIEQDPSLENPWILIHIMLVFLGEALFTVAFIAGSLYIVQERRIKSKQLGSFIKKLPSLTTLDNINHICLLIGFPLLTLGLALGLLSAKIIWGALWNWGQKETWSLITWFLYAILIHGRLASGWKGKKAAIGAVLGFCIIVFSFFVIGYLAPGRHDFLGR
ncbi:cytochrome c biogenesis protein CcsA [Desulfobacterota bacterium AH_259_B03_O07]|nr:cytochrome c biogenesis protein CcsA [Desulfobacterota bacterium AH_259_B03_O07]